MEMAIWHFYCITKAFLLHGLSFALYYIIATSPFNHKSVIMLRRVFKTCQNVKTLTFGNFQRRILVSNIFYFPLCVGIEVSEN